MLKIEMDRAGRGVVRALCVIALTLLATNAAAQQPPADDSQPAILSRTTSIYVHYDGSLDVSETTVVNAAAPQAFHRDLSIPGHRLKARDIAIEDAYEVYPSAYEYQTGGQTSASVAQRGDGVRINVQPTRQVGPRKFQIDYRVRYGVHGKQLYWPLTAGSNAMPVQHASLRVTFPEATEVHGHLQLDGTSLAGQPSANPGKASRISLAWPDAIDPGQTVSALISIPDLEDTSSINIVPRGPAWLFHGWIWLAALAIYFLAVKVLFTGGNHKPLIAEYEPPAGWSAGALRLLSRGTWDRKCFATGVLGVAAKGGLTLTRQADGAWVATRVGADLIPALTADENSLRSAVFAFGQTTTFSKNNAEGINMAELAYRRALEKRCASERPVDPTLLLMPGWLIALAGAMLLMFGTSGRFALFAELFLPVMLIAIAVAILTGFIPSWILRATRAQAVLAVAICVVGLLIGGFSTAWLAGAMLLAGQVAAGWWLPRQPAKDTALLQQIRGFRWYLETAEQQDMDARYKPSLHPELQASLLPYAMALDVEVAWNAHFAGAVAKTGRQADFAASFNPDHDRAALDLLAFAEAMSQQSRARANDPLADTLTSGT